MGLAERADVIVDFTNVELGDHVLGNVGPDEPFGGGEPGDDFEPSHPKMGHLVIACVSQSRQLLSSKRVSS
jgi:hypothetical protein